MNQQPLWMRVRGAVRAANRRLLIAMACYAVLLACALYALLPAHTSHERFLVGVVVVFFALLVVKTLAHAGEGTMD